MERKGPAAAPLGWAEGFFVFFEGKGICRAIFTGDEFRRSGRLSAIIKTRRLFFPTFKNAAEVVGEMIMQFP